MNFGVILFCLIMVVINRFIYGKYINFPTVITAIWGTSLSFAMLGLYEVFVPPEEVVTYTLMFIIAINCFSALWHFLMRGKRARQQKDPNIRINNRLLTFILVLCSILLVITLWDSLMNFYDTGDFSVVRNSFINYEVVGMHSQVLVTITLLPLGKAAYLMAAVDYVYNKKVKSSLIMAIAFALISVVLTGGRGTLFFFILAFFVALYHKEKSLRELIRNNKKVVAVGAIGVLIMLFVTSQRGFGDSDVFKSIYVYFAGCFNLFGVYIKNGFLTPALLYGQALISGLSFPFLEYARFVMGIDVLPGNYILAEEATSQYYSISQSININATPTTMFPAMRDFGVAGLFIYPAAICFVYQIIKNWCQKRGNIVSVAFYAYFVSCALLLNMSYQFGTFQTVSVFVYMFIIYKLSNLLTVSQTGKRKSVGGIVNA